MDIRERTGVLLAGLNKGMYEREEPLRLAFLSAIAGESIFFLGPPGVAKSLIARRLKYAFRDARSFEYLMNRFSTPDEIFGPVSIKKLKDEDKYVRLTDNYLPGSNIVFLDEIWKAGPSIQNALLTILNEKVYRNGDQEVVVKLRGIISASNELPAEGQGLEALWDRFLVRCFVTGIQDKESFNKMVTCSGDLYGDEVPEDHKLADEEVRDFVAAIGKIEVPSEVLELIHAIRFSLQEENHKLEEELFYVSDRRWKKIVHLLKASAFLNGRSKVDLMDCFLISHCIWQRPEDIDIIRQIVAESIRRNTYSINLNLAALEREVESFQLDVQNGLLEKRKVEKPAPTVFDSDYYALDGFHLGDSRYYASGPNREPMCFVKITDYQALSYDVGLLTIFGKEGNRYAGKESFRARLGSAPFHIAFINTNGSNNVRIEDIKIKVTTVETEEVIRKKPHAILVEHWNKQAGVLKNLVDERKRALDNYLQTDLWMTRRNLFVDARNADILEDKVQNLRKHLEGMDLSIEKIVHMYSDG